MSTQHNPVVSLSLNRSPFCRLANGKIIPLFAGECATVTDVLDALPELNSHGFRCDGRAAISDAKHHELREELLNPGALGGLSPETMKRLSGWLSSFSPSRQWKQNSYTLKHLFEREAGTYMANGAFVVCVLMAGFEIKIAGPDALIKMRRAAL